MQGTLYLKLMVRGPECHRAYAPKITPKRAADSATPGIAHNRKQTP